MTDREQEYADRLRVYGDSGVRADLVRLLYISDGDEQTSEQVLLVAKALLVLANEVRDTREMLRSEFRIGGSFNRGSFNRKL